MFYLYKNWLKFGIFVIFSYITLADASTPFSQYGMIQNVQDYSASPFYNSSSYAPSAPKLVYSSGPALKPSDCERAVKSLIENACAQRNNCKNAKLSDIRPTIMVALSTMPGYNYASSCSGYIDTIFEQYKKQSSVTSPLSVTLPQTNTKTPQTGNIPQWQQEYNERAAELKALQDETNSVTDSITKTDFPKTFNDLSFLERNQILAQGYQPYKNARVYEPIKIKAPEEGIKSTTEVLKEQQPNLKNCITDYQNKYNKTQTELAQAEAYLNYLETQLIPWALAIEAKWNRMTSADRNALPPEEIANHYKAKAILELVDPSKREDPKQNPKKVIKDAKEAIENAKKANDEARDDATNSPCLCTKTMDSRFRTYFLNKMQVTCDANNKIEQ